MKKFKYLPSLGISYREQGRAFFLAQSYDELTEQERKKIRAACQEAGGPDYGDALLEYMTTGISWQEICRKHYISDRTLDRARAKFYKIYCNAD